MIDSEISCDSGKKQLVELLYAYKVYLGEKREHFFVAAGGLEPVFQSFEVSQFGAKSQTCFGLDGLGALSFGASRSFCFGACYLL